MGSPHHICTTEYLIALDNQGVVPRVVWFITMSLIRNGVPEGPTADLRLKTASFSGSFLACITCTTTYG